MGQPGMVDDNFSVRFQPFDNLATLPIPKDDVALTITTTDISSVGRKANLTGITGNSMTGESLFPVLTEGVGRVDEDLVVERLSSKVLLCQPQS